MADNNITVDLGENSVRVADAHGVNDQIEVLSLGYQSDSLPFYINETEKIVYDEAKMIENLIATLKIKKKSANVVIPDGYTFSQIIEMPKLKEKELLSAIKYQADQFIPMPLADTALDLEILSEDVQNKKLLVLIVAAPQKLITRVTKVIELSGLIPDTIENELSSLGRLLSTMPQIIQDGSKVLFLNFGYSTSSLYFFDTEKKLILDVHTFKLGYVLFLKEAQITTNFDIAKTKEILKSIGISKDASLDIEKIVHPVTDELMREVEKFTYLLKEKYQIEKIDHMFIFNEAHNINMISQKMEERFGIPTSLFDFAGNMKSNQIVNTFSQEISSFVSAISGCLR